MNHIILILSFSIIFGLTKAINEQVYAGASTSGLQLYQLSNSERCEIDSFVDNLINTITEARSNGRLEHNEYNDDRYESMNMYYTVIGECLRYGSNFNNTDDNRRRLLPNYDVRKRYYNLNVRDRA